MDENCNPVPAGVVGEIAVGGPQVGRGYMNRPDANTKSFIVNPFCSDGDRDRGWTRMFLTGDRGCFLNDGRLEFHGRVAGDKQVKLRGFRIDLAEIENRIFAEAKARGFPGLIDVSVVARAVTEDTDSLTDNRQLIAYVVPSEDMKSSAPRELVSYLNEQLSKHLNDYMLPNGYQFLERLPVTIGGKVDRQNLLNRSLTLIYPATDSTEQADAQSGSLEKSIDDSVLNTVLGLFKEVLKLPLNSDISPSDNFFKIGGSSILLVRFQAKVKKAFGKAPNLPDMFKTPTGEGIAQLVQRKVRSTKQSEKKKLTTQEINWSKEATLPDQQQWLVRPDRHRLSRPDIHQVLITGVDSYIGIHMLNTLLSEQSLETIHLLASDRDASYEDLFSVMERYQLMTKNTKASVLKKTRIVAGNLKAQRFGLGDTEFRKLGETVQAIYHLGGSVSLLKSYEDLKQMNVSATLDIIELASLGHNLTEIHHLSTWSIPHLQTWETAQRTKNSIITTELGADHFKPEPSNRHGYFKSRWVSEMLMTQAAARGFPVSIYRASAVSGMTESTAPEPSNDFIRSMVRSMIQFGCVPQIGLQKPEFAVDFIPVNYLTSSIHCLATTNTASKIAEPSKIPSIFHLGNENPLPLSKLPAFMSKIRQDGRRGRALPLDAWLDVVSRDEDPEAQLRWAVLRDYFTAGHNMFALDRTETSEALQKTQEGEEAGGRKVAACPSVNGEEYLKFLFKGL